MLRYRQILFKFVLIKISCYFQLWYMSLIIDVWNYNSLFYLWNLLIIHKSPAVSICCFSRRNWHFSGRCETARTMSTKNKLNQYEALDYLENVDKEDSDGSDEEDNVVRIGELVFLPSTSTERRDTLMRVKVTQSSYIKTRF